MPFVRNTTSWQPKHNPSNGSLIFMLHVSRNAADRNDLLLSHNQIVSFKPVMLCRKVKAVDFESQQILSSEGAVLHCCAGRRPPPSVLCLQPTVSPSSPPHSRCSLPQRIPFRSNTLFLISSCNF